MVVVMFLVTCPVSSALLRGTAAGNPRFLDVERLDKHVLPTAGVVVGWQQDFAKIMRYSRKSGTHYYFLLDWPAALAGPPANVLDYHLMQSYRDSGYYSENIQDSRAFLCSHTDFLVLDAHSLVPLEPEPTWFDFAVRNNPVFTWKTIESFDAPDMTREMIAVHRRAPLNYCDQP
jgi:hypothetical protein